MHKDTNLRQMSSPLQLERGRGRGRTAGGEAEKPGERKKIKT